VRDLRDFWNDHYAVDPYRNLEVFLLRNLPRIGVGFFRRSGFYPDFILWITSRVAERTRVLFIEPHGLHHGGLGGNQDKIEALKELQAVSEEAPFQNKKISLGGYLLTDTELKEIPGAEDKDWATLERDYRVLHQEGAYMQKILT